MEIYFILAGISMCWAVFCILGYALYKVEKLDSWAEGLKELINSTIQILRCVGKGLVSYMQFCYGELTGKMPDAQIINPAIILAKEEVLELVQRFKNSLYDIPTLVQFIPNANGVLWIEIGAVKLYSTYKELSFSELEKIASSIINNFYYELRGFTVPIYIKVAQKDRLYFAIPLCADGEAFLKKQEQFQGKASIESEKYLNLFEEEIPNLADRDGDRDDTGL